MTIGKRKLTFEEGIMLAGLILVGLFGFSMLFGKMLGFSFAVGYIPLLLGVVLTVTVMFAITMKTMRGEMIGTKDVVTLLIISAITVLAMMYLPDLIPPAFEQSALSLKSALPLP